LTSSSRILVLMVVAVIVVLAVYTVDQATSIPGAVTTGVPSSFTVNGRTYTFTYIATDEAQREAGLMNKKVGINTTMLFAFPRFDYWQFWMYDTNASLDMIWVNATGNSGRVVYLVTSAQPCFDSASCQRYTPTSQADYVIEAKAGFAAANSVEVGTTIQLA